MSRARSLSFLFLLFFLSFFPREPVISRANEAGVVINEIAWMGATGSPNKEWIELYNNSTIAIDLNGWRLVAKDGAPTINLKNKIPPRGFFLLERTSDGTRPGVKADLIYKGSLKNQGEDLILVNEQKITVDEVNCSAKWFAGDNGTKQTMERINPLAPGNSSNNWQTSKMAGGTPKAENQIAESQPRQDGERTAEINQQPFEAAPNKNYPAGVVINEILPSPKGPDKENEWIELKNLNNQEVDLSDWKIQDSIGLATVYLLPKKTKIPPRGFLLLRRPETGIILQNSGDTLGLVQPNGNITDTITYKKALLGQSYNRGTPDWFWSSILTPGAKNTTAPSLTEKRESEKPLAVPPKNENTKDVKNKTALASVGQQTSRPLNNLWVSLFALAIGAISGLAVLFIKRHLKRKQG